MKAQSFFSKYIIASWIIMLPLALAAQTDPWPKVIDNDQVKITVYQPQPESLEGNLLKVRSAISAKNNSMKDPVFGVLWADVRLKTDRDNRIATLETIDITDLRLPAYPDSNQLTQLANIIEADARTWNLEISIDRLLATLDEVKDADKLAAGIKNAPPKILIADKPSVLVVLDGEPVLNDFENTGLKQVVNTPFFMLFDPGRSTYYLNGDGIWYSSPSFQSGWQPVSKLPANIDQLSMKLEKAGSLPSRDSVDRQAIQSILVSTEPAELIQSDGAPDFASIQGTGLLYMRNSSSNVFLDTKTQQYFVLLSGRWYSAKSLNSNWLYVASEDLPADFKNIPVGSEKDIVLASVAGTQQAKDALKDAQIPQTATVDRNSTTASVKYDGDPQFEKIQGTDDLYYAPNTSTIVLREGTKYYAVDNGVWFESDDPNGPWQVAINRPDEVEEIPPSSPAYNVKYVYIYDYTPQVVYVGYTPGYLGSYIYGPTIVYGTGWYYHPWHRHYFFPRPYTWGFNMYYNPWTGWSFGLSFNYGGWFYYPYVPYYSYWYGGWWGPSYYHPPYQYWCNHYYGEKPVYSYNNFYYGPRNYYSGNNKPDYKPVEHIGPNTNDGSGNLYLNRPGITSSHINTGDGTGSINRPGSLGGKESGGRNVSSGREPATQQQGGGVPANQNTSKRQEVMKNDVYTDPKGNIYRGKDDSWKVYDGNNNKWVKPKSQNQTAPRTGNPSQGTFDRSGLQKQQQQRDLGNQRNQSYKQYQQGTQRQSNPRSNPSKPPENPRKEK